MGKLLLLLILTLPLTSRADMVELTPPEDSGRLVDPRFPQSFPTIPILNAQGMIVRNDKESDLRKIYQTISSLLLELFKQTMAPQDGIEHPDLFETSYGEHLVKIASTRCVATMQGVANLRYISGSYFYSQTNGALGFRCNLMPESMPNTVVSIQISPAAGTIALIRLHAGLNPTDGMPDLPTQVLVGSEAGIEAMHRFHEGITAGFRLYARAEMNPMNIHEAGVTTYEAAYLNFDIHRILGPQFQVPLTISLKVQGGDRGPEKEPIYGVDLSPARGADQLRTFLEGMISVALTF